LILIFAVIYLQNRSAVNSNLQTLSINSMATNMGIAKTTFKEGAISKSEIV
jgi:hypothetical protein